MKPLKILVSGPVNAGKSTLVRTLSSMPAIDTDEAATDEVRHLKSLTTVALDFGELIIDGTTILLFGTPGQERFEFMWEILSEGALGIILLVPGNDPSSFPMALRNFDALASRIAVPFLIGVSKQDLPPVWEPADVATLFRVPAELVQPVVCTEYSSALRLVANLLEVIDAADQQRALLA